MPSHPTLAPPSSATKLVCWLTLLFLLSSLLPAMLQPAPESSAGSELSWLALVTLFLLYVPMIISVSLEPKPPRPKLSFAEWVLWLVLPIVLVFCLNAFMLLSGLMDWLATLTQSPMEQGAIDSLRTGDWELKVFIAIQAVVIAAVGEEFLLRGGIYRCVKERSGKWVALLASSLLFGAMHGALLQMLPLTLLGFILALSYERARSLYLPVAIHALFNAVNVALTLWEVPQ